MQGEKWDLTLGALVNTSTCWSELFMKDFPKLFLSNIHALAALTTHLVWFNNTFTNNWNTNVMKGHETQPSKFLMHFCLFATRCQAAPNLDPIPFTKRFMMGWKDMGESGTTAEIIKNVPEQVQNYLKE